MKIIENPTWQIKNTNSVFIVGLQFIFSIPNRTVIKTMENFR
jgi:hypothetical protein